MIAAGERHTCALRLDGTPMCWGNNYRGQTAAPRDEVLANIHAGGSHTCGVRPDTTPVCWGDNTHDQNWPPFSAPTPTPTPRPFLMTGTGDATRNTYLEPGTWRLTVNYNEGCTTNCTATDFKVSFVKGDVVWDAVDKTNNSQVAQLLNESVTFKVGQRRTATPPTTSRRAARPSTSPPPATGRCASRSSAPRRPPGARSKPTPAREMLRLRFRLRLQPRSA